MGRLTTKNFRPTRSVKQIKESMLLEMYDKLAHYEDLEEQGRLIEVVRCKECYHRIERCGMGSHKWCEIWEGTTGENDFCSYGVARTEIEEAESKLEELKGE